ncbi:MAG TPA: hydroxymethylbilane synthase, partial [Candidatus Elarobacter sp.]|nr:hydroxymethylbilane synthase [Candidatus Elarobacter sp.]
MTSAAKSAPRSAARAGTDRICWKITPVYPVALSVRGRRAVVVGGGGVAERKVRGLLAAGADVVVVAPDATSALAGLASHGEIAWRRHAYRRGDLDGAWLAFAATGDPDVNAAVAQDSHAAGILLNDASEPSRGDFATPAVHRAGDLTVAVDSGGLAPAFAKRVRDELAIAFDSRYARAAATLAALRERVLAVVPAAGRAAVMRHFAERDIEELAAMPPGAVEHEVERAAETLAGVVPRATTALVCATRGSALALIQTKHVVAALARAGIPSTILTVTTRGDAVQDRAIAAIGTDNVFVTELELALRERRADYAVHSAKDLPSALAADMTLAAITAREDPRDAFCSERFATFEALPSGARVGTSSPRRRAQLRALRADLTYDDVRGNVDTRLRKLRDGEYDAIVLACAGLHRLGVAATHTVPFAVDAVTPAVGQGALALEARAGDPVGTILANLNDPAASLAVRAERAFLRTLRGGCQAPIGCHAVWDGGRLGIVAAVAPADGARVLRGRRDDAVAAGDIEAAESAGVALAHELLADGAAAVLGGGPLSGRLFLLPRTQDRQSRIAPALRDAGAE